MTADNRQSGPSSPVEGGAGGMGLLDRIESEAMDCDVVVPAVAYPSAGLAHLGVFSVKLGSGVL